MHSTAAAKPLLRKKVVEPKLPMKPLYWTRIVVPVQPTLQTVSEDQTEAE